VGFGGQGLLRGWGAAAAAADRVVYATGFAYALSVVPLFILMGHFVACAGLAHERFRAASAFIGHFRDGLAPVTLLACNRGGAICGSSIVATAGVVAGAGGKRPHHGDAVFHPDRRDEVFQLHQLHLVAGRLARGHHPPGPVAADGGGRDGGGLWVAGHQHGRVVEGATDYSRCFSRSSPSWVSIRSGLAC
jgi:hypothetical protein